ncbi:hypothetical protein DAPPUDRAFT_107786 [Daphnia pulex]|uniref:Peptidase S1 domain-containing protein n=1 Tax=Daphnia pulex TaxID=6669 RepID=E9GY87_DAPPU|nr:hypothetical protein DAPPUDRAFT_107786 [Daphnia pulex]|eukprot:EFX75607.1 hypothetical protein DAPPUDRAFT_107786 [Daphnia pulex]
MVKSESNFNTWKASTMKYSSTFVYTFLLIATLHGATQARIYQTSDAIITEAEDFSGGLKGRSIHNDDDAVSWISSASLPKSEPVSSGSTKPVRALPSGTYLLTDRTCWTPDGKIGTCSSVRSCNSNMKLPSKKGEVDSGKLGARGTCVYAEPDGRQSYGICCTVKQAPPFGSFGQGSGFPFAVPSNPWWPTYFPFSPSVAGAGFAPLPTVTSRPSTTSPWWVPDAVTTSRPSGPSTTSPWWVPDVVTSTTSRPSTTSPWWVPDSVTSTTAAKPVTTSTSTKKPSTTSPWWVPESTTSKPSVLSSTAPVVVDSGPSGTNVACGAGPYRTLSADEQERIVGGTTATRNSWPFVVALFSNGRHFCGGSLMDSSHILTAAHCIAHMSSTDVSRLEVALAMHTLKPFDSQAVRKRVRRIVRHKGFNAVTLYNDVAILTLDSPVQFSAAIAPVCLPPKGSNEQFVSKESTVVGWGALKEGGRQPDVLQQVTVQIQSNAECKKNYGKDAPGGIVDHMICAAYPGKDSCSEFTVALHPSWTGYIRTRNSTCDFETLLTIDDPQNSLCHDDNAANTESVE